MSKIKNKEKHSNWKNADFYLFYTLAFAGIALFLYMRFYLNGKSLVWSHDGIPQHLNSLAYYGKYLRGILHTLFVEHRISIPMWDLNIGYGSDILTTLHYYVIGDPLTLLSVFFKPAQTELLYEILIFLRIYLAGIAFSRYSFYHKNSKQAVFMGTMIYIFAGWTIYAAMKHPYFSNPMIYLPFILMGIDKIYKKEKPYIFIWSVAFAGLSNFYFFYMLGIFMILYAVFRYFEEFADRSVKNIARWIAVFAVYSVIAVLIAAVILLPVILPVFGTDRFKAENYVPLLYDKVYYEKYLGCLIGENMIQWGVAGFTAVSLTGVFVLFAKRKKYRTLKAGFVMVNLFLLLPYAGHVLNGFSYVSNRWIWAYGMLIAYIFVKIYPELFTLTLKEKRTVFVMLLVYCGLALLPDAARTQRNMMAVIFLVAATFTVLSFGSLFVRRRNLTIMVSGFLVAGILFNIYYQYSYEKDYLSEFSDQGEALDKLETGTDLAVLDTEDASLYRYDQMGANSCENSSMQTGTNSTAYYFSVASASIGNFFDEIYLNTPWEQHYENLDGRTILDRLAAVKYFVVRAGEEEYLPYGYNKLAGEAEKNGKTYRAYTCQQTLPFGYTYDTCISREKYEKMSAIEKQQALLQGVVLEESTLPETEVKFNDREVPYKIITGQGCREKDGKLIVTKENAQVRLVFDGENNSETYLITEGMDYDALSPREMVSDKKWENMTLYEQNQLLHENSSWRYWKESQKAYVSVSGNFLNKKISIFTDRYNAYSGKHDFLCNTGYSKMGKNSVTLTFENTGVYSWDSLKVVCQPMTEVDSQTERLAQEKLEKVVIKDHELMGEITLSKKKALVIALPYSTGFSAYVDGKETELKQANTMYMALELPKGKHTIRITYHTPYLYTGLCLTCVGLLCYIGVVLIFRKKRGNKKG
ncbi:YfhO family protein [Blautia sp. MSJ-19]|uniref:YfhO family protein n=1 Tax=Blautia sp. MSJ-19 TaxID=2841517 RepID=UPI001C0F282B|nr:YfhO family protein [Blautia sp. MSJ-19]MBU5482341.1 YfhO family protein [Blautia sp. MSJ-19]